jgi:putative transposase
MNTRAIAAEYRLTHWAGIMRERQESGLSIKAFCEMSGFHENIYYYWQRRLREAACEKLASQQPEGRPDTAAIVSGGWTAVCTMTEPVKDTIHIEIGKCRIAVTAETNHDLLAAVCRTLTRAESRSGPTLC